MGLWVWNIAHIVRHSGYLVLFCWTTFLLSFSNIGYKGEFSGKEKSREYIQKQRWHKNKRATKIKFKKINEGMNLITSTLYSRMPMNKEVLKWCTLVGLCGSCFCPFAISCCLSSLVQLLCLPDYTISEIHGIWFLAWSHCRGSGPVAHVYNAVDCNWWNGNVEVLGVFCDNGSIPLSTDGYFFQNVREFTELMPETWLTEEEGLVLTISVW